MSEMTKVAFLELSQETIQLSEFNGIVCILIFSKTKGNVVYKDKFSTEKSLDKDSLADIFKLAETRSKTKHDPAATDFLSRLYQNNELFNKINITSVVIFPKNKL